MKKILNIFLILLASLVLIGCNHEGNNSDDNDKTLVSHYVTTNGVRDVLKEDLVTINPKRVALYDLSILDILDSTGFENFNIEKLILPKGSLPDYLSEYNDDKYINGGTLFDIDFELLDVHLPDLIVIGGRSSAHYDALKEHYKEYSFVTILDVSNTNFSIDRFSKVVENLSKVFPSMEDELTERHDELVTKVDSIKNNPHNYKASLIMVTGTDYSVYGKGSRFDALFTDFGFTASDNNLDATENPHGLVIDSEYFDNIDPDVIFFIDRGAATGTADPGLDAAMNNPYIKATTAGVNNHLYTLNSGAWYILPGGFRSLELMIEDIEVFINALID